MSVFLMVWNIGGVRMARQPILDFLNGVAEVENWRAYPGSIFLKSSLQHDQIAEKLNQQFPNGGFLIIPLSECLGGWADPDLWKFLGIDTDT